MQLFCSFLEQLHLIFATNIKLKTSYAPKLDYDR